MDLRYELRSFLDGETDDDKESTGLDAGVCLLLVIKVTEDNLTIKMVELSSDDK